MIHFEIIESPDLDIKDKFKYFQDQIYLGRKNGNLNIDDPELHDSHIMIEVVGSELLIHPQSGIGFYLIDGKRSTTIRKIQAGQKITIGKTTLKVIEYGLSSPKTKKEVLDEKLAVLMDKNSPRLSVIERLSQMMK